MKRAKDMLLLLHVIALLFGSSCGSEEAALSFHDAMTVLSSSSSKSEAHHEGHHDTQEETTIGKRINAVYQKDIISMVDFLPPLCVLFVKLSSMADQGNLNESFIKEKALQFSSLIAQASEATLPMSREELQEVGRLFSDNSELFLHIIATVKSAALDKSFSDDPMVQRHFLAEVIGTNFFFEIISPASLPVVIPLVQEKQRGYTKHCERNYAALVALKEQFLTQKHDIRNSIATMVNAFLQITPRDNENAILSHVGESLYMQRKYSSLLGTLTYFSVFFQVKNMKNTFGTLWQRFFNKKKIDDEDMFLNMFGSNGFISSSLSLPFFLLSLKNHCITNKKNYGIVKEHLRRCDSLLAQRKSMVISSIDSSYISFIDHKKSTTNPWWLSLLEWIPDIVEEQCVVGQESPFSLAYIGVMSDATLPVPSCNIIEQYFFEHAIEKMTFHLALAERIKKNQLCFAEAKESKAPFMHMEGGFHSNLIEKGNTSVPTTLSLSALPKEKQHLLINAPSFCGKTVLMRQIMWNLLSASMLGVASAKSWSSSFTMAKNIAQNIEIPGSEKEFLQLLRNNNAVSFIFYDEFMGKSDKVAQLSTFEKNIPSLFGKNTITLLSSHSGILLQTYATEEWLAAHNSLVGFFGTHEENDAVFPSYHFHASTHGYDHAENTPYNFWLLTTEEANKKKIKYVKTIIARHNKKKQV